MITYGVRHCPFWLSRRQALAIGMTHEGRHGGIGVYVREIEASAETGWEPSFDVLAKCPLLEHWLTLGGYWLQFVNLFRAADDPMLFGFLLRPIPQPRDQNP